MKKLALCLALLGAIHASSAADLSDAEAKRIAVDMKGMIETTRPQLNGVIAKQDKRSYHRVMGPLLAKLNGWPEMHLSNRAAFPYMACRDAALAMVSYGDAWNRGDTSTIWRDHAMIDFQKQYATCQRDIVKPDMSLKDIQ